MGESLILTLNLETSVQSIFLAQRRKGAKKTVKKRGSALPFVPWRESSSQRMMTTSSISFQMRSWLAISVVYQ